MSWLGADPMSVRGVCKQIEVAEQKEARASATATLGALDRLPTDAFQKPPRRPWNALQCNLMVNESPELPPDGPQIEFEHS